MGSRSVGMASYVCDDWRICCSTERLMPALACKLGAMASCHAIKAVRLIVPDCDRRSILGPCASSSSFTRTFGPSQPKEAKQDFYTVGDFMTSVDDLFVVKQSTTVDEALELLVENRITGLPVVDDAGKLVGVVSDYDLLALDSISGKRTSDNSLFPEADSTWKVFKEIQVLLSKTQGRTVGEVMTPSPLIVRKNTNLEDAARLLLESKYRRLPVVDESGKLLGLITRGNVIRAALKVQQAEKEAEKSE